MAEKTVQSPGDEARRAALVVAVSTYADPMLRQLRAPAEDATELGTVLADPALGDFSVTTITDGRAHEIRIAVEEFLSEQRQGDLSLVYLSCHGLMDARRRLYFAATDTLKDRLAATGIEARWQLDQLEECRARRQVIILDCCFSGAFAAGSKGDGDLGLGDRFLGQGRGRVVLTASRGTEYSFEGSPSLGADVSEADDLAGLLRQELHETGFDVQRPAVGDAPFGSKGDAMGWAQLAVSFSGGLPALVAAIRAFTQRDETRKVTLTLSNDTLELAGPTSAQQQQLVDAWLARHSGSPASADSP
jgi:hypothetical protein